MEHSLHGNEPLLINLLEEKEEATKWKELFEEDEQIWINTKLTTAQQLIQEEVQKTTKPKVILSEAFEEFRDVFEKATSERFPMSKKWNHAIDLKLDFVTKDCHVSFKSERTRKDEGISRWKSLKGVHQTF